MFLTRLPLAALTSGCSCVAACATTSSESPPLHPIYAPGQTPPTGGWRLDRDEAPGGLAEALGAAPPLAEGSPGPPLPQT
jgi:hypothetical protein